MAAPPPLPSMSTRTPRTGAFWACPLDGVEVGNQPPVDATAIERRRNAAHQHSGGHLELRHAGNRHSQSYLRQNNHPWRTNQSSAEPGGRWTSSPLDGQIRKLIPSDTMVCDTEHESAIAGIMGGLESSVRRRNHQNHDRSGQLDRLRDTPNRDETGFTHRCLPSLREEPRQSAVREMPTSQSTNFFGS